MLRERVTTIEPVSGVLKRHRTRGWALRWCEGFALTTLHHHLELFTPPLSAAVSEITLATKHHHAPSELDTGDDSDELRPVLSSLLKWWSNNQLLRPHWVHRRCCCWSRIEEDVWERERLNCGLWITLHQWLRTVIFEKKN